MAETANAPMAVSDEVAIQIQNMNKWYGSFHVLRDIDLTVYRGERIVIAGPSGSGKSTLIRCINALEEHQKGSITVDGTLLSSDIKNIDTIRSEVGLSCVISLSFLRGVRNISLSAVTYQAQKLCALF
ncbi:MAG: ATP-binding cassette domain-containing protein, partial [Marivita sp.]